MRRSESVGSPMLVKLPTDGYWDTGEGGMAFFLIVRCKADEERRQTCIAGDIWWGEQDCVLSPRILDKPQCIDGGLLIGSTGQSLWTNRKGKYFIATLKDLTPKGRRLYHSLKRLYGQVNIVTLLDT
mgnify:CR=1 FL=1